MKIEQPKYFPTVIEAAHLVILYLFIQALIDFPLALWDYYHGTDYLSHPVKRNIVNVGSVVFILLFAWRKSHAKLPELFPVKRFNLLIIIPMTAFLMAAHVFLVEVNTIVDKLIPAPPWFLELLNRLFENKFGIYGTAIKVALIAPIVEELIFRGIIMHGFMRNYHSVTAILVSALFFALFHLNPWQFPTTFLLGLLLGWIMVITRNIIVCIIGHSINNLLVLLIIEFHEPLSETAFFLMEKSKQLTISYIVAGLCVMLIALIALFKKKKNKIFRTLNS